MLLFLISKMNLHGNEVILMKYILTFLGIIVGFIAITFPIYWFNADMKLVRFVYDKLQVHYDNMKRDRKL